MSTLSEDVRRVFGDRKPVARHCEATVLNSGAHQACDRPLDERGYCDRPSEHIEEA